MKVADTQTVTHKHTHIHTHGSGQARSYARNLTDLPENESKRPNRMSLLSPTWGQIPPMPVLGAETHFYALTLKLYKLSEFYFQQVFALPHPYN